MTPTDISILRIQNQQVEGSNYKTPKELVAWMGAMQAQDFSMAKWAVGLRVPGSTEASVEEAYNRGEILRTHLMRPTWHFVSPEDISWMLELTAPQIKKILKTNDKRFEFNETVYSTCITMLEKVLSNMQCMTREELVQEFENIHIRTDENRLSHILIVAELAGVVCSGPMRGNKLTYMLLADRVPKIKSFTREEALATLATRYFKSHGSATVRDFVWWSGLTITDARKAMESIKSSLISETIDSETYWMAPGSSHRVFDPQQIRLLPAFDEILIGYANRSAALASVHNKKIISVNGIFRPIIVENGQVKGLWKRNTLKDRVLIEASLFQPFPEEIKRNIEEEAKRVGEFLNKRVEIIISENDSTLKII
jgi:hypothetical protein